MSRGADRKFQNENPAANSSGKKRDTERAAVPECGQDGDSKVHRMGAVARLITRTIDWCYFPFLRKYIPLLTFRYGVCGVFNMALDTLLYYISYHYIFREMNVDLGLFVLSPHMASLGLVFPFTFFNGFWLNRNVAFKHSPLRHRTQLGRYLISVGGSIAINIFCMKLFVDAIEIWPTPSKILTTLVSTVYSYLMQKHFSFRGFVDI